LHYWGRRTWTVSQKNQVGLIGENMILYSKWDMEKDYDFSFCVSFAHVFSCLFMNEHIQYTGRVNDTVGSTVITFAHLSILCTERNFILSVFPVCKYVLN
jgi:hypothetical protein